MRVSSRNVPPLTPYLSGPLQVSSPVLRPIIRTPGSRSKDPPPLREKEGCGRGGVS